MGEKVRIDINSLHAFKICHFNVFFETTLIKNVRWKKKL